MRGSRARPILHTHQRCRTVAGNIDAAGNPPDSGTQYTFCRGLLLSWPRRKGLFGVPTATPGGQGFGPALWRRLPCQAFWRLIYILVRHDKRHHHGLHTGLGHRRRRSSCFFTPTTYRRTNTGVTIHLGPGRLSRERGRLMT